VGHLQPRGASGDAEILTPRLRWGYGLAALAVFAIEVVIALFVRDAVMRPHVGDVLAVVLVYLGVRAVTPLKVAPAVGLALAIAVIVELGQLFHLLDALGLAHDRLVRVVLGGVFDFKDLACYAAGAICVIIGERFRT
jgi:hypothetical protein